MYFSFVDKQPLKKIYFFVGKQPLKENVFFFFR